MLILFISLVYQALRLNSQEITNQTEIIATPIASYSAQLHKVKRVIDGDTIELENGQKVRYIGIDAPELHHPKKSLQCFGREAMLINQELVEGKVIRLEKDFSETDKYRRLLRYVYVPTESSPSGLFVNDYLVKEGYASASTYPPDVKYSDQFKTAERIARINNLGLWNKCRE